MAWNAVSSRPQKAAGNKPANGPELLEGTEPRCAESRWKIVKELPPSWLNSPKEKTVNERQWAAIDRSGLLEDGRCTRRTLGNEFSEACTVFLLDVAGSSSGTFEE